MLCSITSRRFISVFFPLSQSLSTKPISQSHTDFDPTAVHETLYSYCNDWKRALDFFNWVQTQSHFQHTTHTYNRMLDILCKFFEFQLSWDLIHRMKTNPFSKPDHTTFRILFKRYICAHLVTEAVGIYDSLEEFGLKDEMSFCNLIDALCEYKHVVEAYDLCFGKNKKFGVDTKNTKIYNMILRGWFKMGWWSKCREFWEEMDQMGVRKDLHSYSIYMDIMCKSGKPWKAVKLYKEMKKKGIRLDVVVYNTVIRAVGLSEGVDCSVRVFKEMRDFGCKPEVATYNTIIKLFCENGRYKEAYELLDRMHEKGCVPDVITFNCIFRCLEKPREILRLLDRMIESGVRPRMDTYVMLLRKFGRWGFLRPAFIVWEKMEELGCSPDESAYNALIDALVDKGMVDMARKYDEEMLAKGLSAKPREELGTKLIHSADMQSGYTSRS
ncbi:hypothetical protein CMV_009922 [Castanea mollissima]|nr:hypothetical protein CMV_009922 [Castanea mollissima]